MHIGIAGADAIAMGYAAYFINAGHHPFIWSPSGRGTSGLAAGQALEVSGKIEGEFRPEICPDAKTLTQSDAIILALPAYGHRAVLDALEPHLEARHTVIISGHLSFAALYLSKKLAARGLTIPIVGWSTTALTAKAQTANHIKIGVLRKNIDMAVIPAARAEEAKAICEALFGPKFTLKDDLLTIALSNLNPQNHLGIALCNLTRIERGETWAQNTNITPSVANLLAGLDAERVALANALGKTVRSITENFASAFGIDAKSVYEGYQAQLDRGNDPAGPTEINTRYVLEDVPFGLAATLMLAKLANVPMPLHQGGVDILSACYGRDFVAGNDLLPDLAIADMASLDRLVANGYAV